MTLLPPMDPSSSSSSPSPWRRSVKRKLESVDSPSPSPSSLEPAADGLDASELRAIIEEKEREIEKLVADLDAEREASETAVDEAMLMIERLRQEKSAAQMELRQVQRSAASRAALEQEVEIKLIEYSSLAESYRQRLISHGFDPEIDGDENPDANTANGGNGGGADGEEISELRVAGASGSSTSELAEEMVKEKVEMQEFEKGDVYSVVAKNVNGEMYGVRGLYANGELDVKDLHLRLAALESERAAMRRAIVAVWTEQAQLAVLKEMARQKFREAVASDERTMARKKPLFTSLSSIFAMLKWVFAVIFHKKRTKTKYAIGLSTTLLGLLLLMEKSSKFGKWQLFPRTRALPFFSSG